MREMVIAYTNVAVDSVVRKWRIIIIIIIIAIIIIMAGMAIV